MKIDIGSNGSISLLASLSTVLFIGLKLTGYIVWSWFWVLFPIIFVLGLIIILLILYGILNLLLKK